jgi:hypothetical protein
VQTAIDSIMRVLIFIVCLALFMDCHAQSYVSREKALEDIDYFNNVIGQVHVNPFLFINKQKYFSEVQFLKKKIKDSIEIKDFLRLLYKMTALLKDGHTTPYLAQAAFRNELQRELFFPYALVIEDNKLYVPRSTSAVSGIPTGAVIYSINDKNVKELLSDMSKYSPGTEAHAKEIQNKFFSYYLFLAHVSAPFRIQYEDSSGKKHQTTIEKGARFIDALSVTMPHLKSSYSFRIIDNKLGYFDFMNMSVDLNELDKYFDSCMTVLKNNNIRNLAVDLRKNSGGNSVTGDLLLSYFTEKKYLLSGGKDWKISDLYKEQLRKNGDSANLYLSKQAGSIWHTNTCVPHPPLFNVTNSYDGKVVFLINPFTFSSANMLADGAKEFKLATLVGEESGENCSDFGEAFTFLLPNSRIRMQASSSFEYGANCDASKFAPVIPDKKIVSSLSDKINERDRPVEFLLKNID